MGKTIARVLGGLLVVGGLGILGDSYRRIGSFEFMDSISHGARGTPLLIGAVIAGVLLVAASTRGSGET